MKRDVGRAERKSDSKAATPRVVINEASGSNPYCVFSYHNCGHDHVLEIVA
jgi:hypothetical protein